MIDFPVMRTAQVVLACGHQRTWHCYASFDQAHEDVIGSVMFCPYCRQVVIIRDVFWMVARFDPNSG